MFEYACHEDNSAIRNFIEASRFERRQRASAAPMSKSGDPTRPTATSATARSRGSRKRSAKRWRAAKLPNRWSRINGSGCKLLGVGPRGDDARARRGARRAAARERRSATSCASSSRASTACRRPRSRCPRTIPAAATASGRRAVARRSHGGARPHRGAARRSRVARPSAPARAAPARHRGLRRK